MYVLIEGMRGIMKAQGAKPKKIDKPAKQQFGEPDPEEVPHVSEIIAALSGTGTVNG